MPYRRIVPPEEERAVGVMSPYALVEQTLGTRVRWRDLRDHRAYIEGALGIDVESLCGGRKESPLFFRTREDVRRSVREGYLRADAFRRIAAADAVSPARRADALAALFDGEVESGDWTPAGADWADIGGFTGQAPGASHPVQGALGDCYLLAPLSALAWTRPELLRYTLGDTDTITFLPTEGEVAITLTEKVPVIGAAVQPIYARSPLPGEGWPGVYEKAWAKWKSGTAGDKPDYRVIIGGSPASALEELAGLPVTREDIDPLSLTALFDTIKDRSDPDGRATAPMVAWTHASAEDAPTPVSYSDTNVVANHAYTVLGWERVGTARFVLLRNPYGLRDLTGGSVASAEAALFSDAWAEVARADEGVFALSIDRFKSHFRRIAWI